MRTTYSTLLASAALALTLPTLAAAQDVDANDLMDDEALIADDAELMTDDAMLADDAELATGETELADGLGDENLNLQAEIVDLDSWDYEDLYTAGTSLDELLGADVYGPDSDDIGDVENVLFGRNGEILSIVAEIGGFLEFGDTHVNVPWDLVEVMADGNGVMIPISEDMVEEYSLFNDRYGYGSAGRGEEEGLLGDDNVAMGTADVLGDDVVGEDIALDDGTVDVQNVGEVQQVSGDNAGVVETGPQVWRATDLVGTYARLRDGDSHANYGYVDDAIIRDGQIVAVVTSPDVSWGGARGNYAYPYYGFGWTPGAGYYDMPYDRNEVEGMEPFDRERFDG